MMIHSNLNKRQNERCLPDVEVFSLRREEMENEDGDYYDPGWYYWFCFPGCLPDSSPFGPYKTPAAAQKACHDEWSE